MVRVSGFCVLQWKDQLAAVGKKAANLPENRKIFSRCQQGCLWPMSDNTGPKAWHVHAGRQLLLLRRGSQMPQI